VDGGVLAGRFLDRRRLAFFVRKGRPDETSAVHVSRNNTMSSFVSNHARRYMLDLVNVNVVARKRHYAQNV
jgi:hypothetical protein